LAGCEVALEEKTDQAYAIALALDEPHERMKERLVDLVEQFGSADHEKSKLLHGLTHEIVATFGVSTSINAAAVDRFAHVLRVNRQIKLLELIFEQTTRYHLRPDAVALPKDAPWRADFVKEMGDFPAGQHDDVTDAFCHAMKSFTTSERNTSALPFGYRAQMNLRYRSTRPNLRRGIAGRAYPPGRGGSGVRWDRLNASGSRSPRSAIGQQPGFGGTRKVRPGALSHNFGIGLALRLDQVIEDQVIRARACKLAHDVRGVHRRPRPSLPRIVHWAAAGLSSVSGHLS
jgi:hypothetical protein